MGKKWLTVKEYSRQREVSEQSVRDKIKRGTVQNKRINGVVHVLADDAEQQTPATEENYTVTAEETALNNALLASRNIDNELKRERLENLRQDTIIKRLKQEAVKEKYRVEYAEGVLEVFTASFGNVKSYLSSLHLSAEQIKTFQEHFKKSLVKFKKGLEDYIRQKDREEGENEAEKDEF